MCVYVCVYVYVCETRTALQSGKLGCCSDLCCGCCSTFASYCLDSDRQPHDPSLEETHKHTLQCPQQLVPSLFSWTLLIDCRAWTFTSILTYFILPICWSKCFFKKNNKKTLLITTIVAREPFSIADIYSHFTICVVCFKKVKLTWSSFLKVSVSFPHTFNIFYTSGCMKIQKKLLHLQPTIHWKGNGQAGAVPKPGSLVILLYVFSVTTSQNTSWIIQRTNNSPSAENLKC